MNPMNPVSKIMTTDLIKVSPEVNLEKIKHLFENNNIHHIPVVVEKNQIVGIISKEDILRIAYILSLTTSGRAYSESRYRSLKAADIMTKEPLMLDPEDTIGLAADIFYTNHFRALPIVYNGELIGIITTHDLIKYSYNSNTIRTEKERNPQ